MELCGVKLKMSTVYHPETDRSSEHTNKTINQSLHFHVNCQQKGWVCMLPRICFMIMNMVNASTGFSNFQLHLGCLPHVIPPIVPSTFPPILHSTSSQVEALISHITIDVNEVQDNLIAAKAFQAHYANTSRGCEVQYNVGDCIMLSTFH